MIDFGVAESILEEKRSFTNASANDSTLLRLLVSPDDVSFENVGVDLYGVSMIFVTFLCSIGYILKMHNSFLSISQHYLWSVLFLIGYFKSNISLFLVQNV